jgi:capsular exopolysaccharide synthesis family protein
VNPFNSHSSEPSSEIIVSSRSSNPGTARVFCLDPVEQPQKNSDTLVSFFHLIRFRLGTMIAVTLLAVLAGVVLTLNESPTYQALATIELQSGNENMLDRIGDTDVGAPASSADFMQTQLKILQSRTLHERVIAKLKSTQRKPFAQPDQIASWCQALSLKFCSTPQQKAIMMAPVTLQAKESDLSRIIELRADSSDPQMAADFANTLTSEYMEQNMEARWNAAQGAAGWLTKQLDELRAKLENSERELQNYSQASGLLYTDDKSTIADEKLKELQTELSAAQAERLSKEAILSVATSNPVESLPQILDNDRLGEQQTTLADLKRQLAELSSTLTPEHYKVVRVQAQITELETSLSKQRADILRRIRIEYESALLHEKLVASRYEAQAALVTDLDRKAIYYNVLKQEVDTTRHLYDTLLQKVKEFSVASALQASNVRVVDSARPPLQPYKPDLARNMGMGLVTGLMLALGCVLLRERVDRSIKAPGEACFHLKLPELGVIPSILLGAPESRPSEKDRESKNGNGAMVSLGMSRYGAVGERDRVELVTWQDKGSPVAESFRNTLASILFSQQYEKRPRVILITSPGRGEGKSTSATNLAIALAEINQRVLLIDADVRKSTLHTLFDVPNTWGLSDLLRERTPLQDCPLEALARKTSIDSLYILPSGPGTLSVSNLLYSGRMSELLERARKDFDTIVIDTPPILYVADARILARLADAAVLVIRAGITMRDAAIAAKERFEQDGIPVLGIILNDWDLKSKSPYSYAYPSGYEYPPRSNGKSPEKSKAAKA